MEGIFMLYGGFITFKGKIATVIFAGKSTPAMTEEIAGISSSKNNYDEITQPTGLDKIKTKVLMGIKNPITIFIHSSESERDDFVGANQIEILDRSAWEYYQEKMHKEDEILNMQDAHDVEKLDALSGVIHHTSIGSQLGIDKVDPWDTRTEKQKAEDLLNSSHMVARLVEQGMLTDEAVASASEQSGSIEAAILNLVEHIKNGGQMIDPNNVPPEFQAQFDEMVNNGDLRKEDIPRFIDDLNKKVKEYCENDQFDEIMRIFGHAEIDATGTTDGRIFINTKKADKKSIAPPDEQKVVSDIEQKLLTKKSSDELAEILKPAAIDGSLKSDPENYVFNNTSLDKYDLADAIDEIKRSSSASQSEFDVSSLPENIGGNSDIEYSDNTKEFAFHAKIVDEDEGMYAFFPKGIGIEITPENIVGTNNVDVYMVVNGCVLFTFKDKEYKTAYFVVKDKNTYIMNINA